MTGMAHKNVSSEGEARNITLGEKLASPTSSGFFLDPYVFGRHLIGAPVAALTEEGQLGSFVVPVGLKHGSKIRQHGVGLGR